MPSDLNVPSFSNPEISSSQLSGRKSESPTRKNSEAENPTITTTVVENSITECKSDAPATFCWNCCGEEDVATIVPVPERDCPNPIEPQMSNDQTPLVANFCMVCLGDEDISKLRPLSPNPSPDEVSNKVAVASTNDFMSYAYGAPASLEADSLILTKTEVLVAGPSRTHLGDVAFSSSCDSEGASCEQGMSVGTSTEASIYSTEIATQEVCFPFFGGLGATETGSDDEHSAISSMDSAETGSCV